MFIGLDEENSDVLVQKKDSPSSSLIQKPAKKRKVGGKLDTDEREYLDSLLALCFGRSTVSVDFVDDENFRKFLRELNPEVLIISLFNAEVMTIIVFMCSILLLVIQRSVS